MSLNARILIGFLALFGAAIYVISDSIIKEMRPRYLEAVEESLNDTANTLAAMMETQMKNGRLDVSLLGDFFAKAGERSFSARIFGYRKTRVGLNVYVTDNNGTVIFDSREKETLGKDYSRWNDVYRTLRGEYGARSTRSDPADPSSSLLYVAAPIMHGGRIAGVLTVIKPQDSVTPFIEIAKRKLLLGGLITVAALALLSMVLSFWISRPLTRLRRYVASLRTDGSARLPRLGGGEIRGLGREFESLWEELKGKKYIEEYVQSLTHELKSPLTSIRGSAELVQEDMPEERRRDFCRNILRETGRMGDIIEKMLELSELENRRELQDTETVQIGFLVEEVLEGLAPLIERRGLRVEKGIDPKVTVTGERFLLRHALANLLENAVRFSPDGGIISINTEKSNDIVTISITDQGPGIPDYALEKVFNRFYSLPAPDTGKKSTGLGLSFVREVAALHGGRAEVGSGPAGTRAAIVLPV
jgi:two-component system, OmpR family, sensor histidine kinase CreC